MHLFHSLRNADVFEEVLLLDHLYGLFQIDNAFLQHTQFLEAHCHVVIRDVCKVLVSLTVIQIYDFEHTLCFLE